MHPSYRRLDEPPKLAGFSLTQWIALLAWGGAVGGVEHLLGIATQPAISGFTLLVGGPAALVYFSESGRPSLLRLVRDLTRWLIRPRVHEPGAGRTRPLLVRPVAGARGSRRRTAAAPVDAADEAPPR